VALVHTEWVQRHLIVHAASAVSPQGWVAPSPLRARHVVDAVFGGDEEVVGEVEEEAVLDDAGA